MPMGERHRGREYSRFNVIADGNLCLLSGRVFVACSAGIYSGLTPGRAVEPPSFDTAPEAVSFRNIAFPLSGVLAI